MGGKGRKKLEEDKKKGGEKKKCKRGEKEGKKRKRVIGKKHLLGIEPMPNRKSKRTTEKKLSPPLLRLVRYFCHKMKIWKFLTCPLSTLRYITCKTTK